MKILKPKARIAKFEKLGYGMFIHWGLYSQLGQGEWIQNYRKIPKDEYAKLAQTFTAEDFDAGKIVKIAKNAGMKYITLTTRHHDGFSLFDTKGLCKFDAPHSAAKRDLVAEFAAACRAEGIIPFFYHTTLDWYQDSFENSFDDYLEYLNKSVEILCRNYGEIGGLWFDGNWSKPDADWKEDELYATIRKYQPEAMIINNTGLSHRGEPGNIEIDSVTFERGRPTKMDRRGMKKYLAAEMCQTMNEHWGIGAHDFYYLSPKEIIEALADCRKVGANFLLNVGLTATGDIPGYEREALLRVGDWVKEYADIIYNAQPTDIIGQDRDFALTLNGKIYLFIYNLNAAGNKHVSIGGNGNGMRSFSNLKKQAVSVRWLDSGESLKFTSSSNAGLLTIDATGFPYGTNLVVRVAEVKTDE
ncbi:MAG: alpha-L-fucosidase [Victivallaceae bacterium]|nr:alpha-L-fucosidase [Victivallaceae bacterium]